MPNVTISVSEELKAEMDKFPEVSWSEICRNAISRYIAQRKNPAPKIELTLRHARITDYAFETGYPTLSLDLQIHNRMDSEIMVDRILANARFFRIDDNKVYAIGTAYDLHKKTIGSNSSGVARIHLRLPKEKIRELKDEFKSTFDCLINCTVYVEGFKNEYNQEVRTRIPIDDWNDVVKKTLKKLQSD
jgi:hypothetical protein